MSLEIKIERGIPLPHGHRAITSEIGTLRNLIGKMKPGDSAQYNFGRLSQQMAYRAAAHVGATVATRKVNGRGYRVWRVK